MTEMRSKPNQPNLDQTVIVHRTRSYAVRVRAYTQGEAKAKVEQMLMSRKWEIDPEWGEGEERFVVAFPDPISILPHFKSSERTPADRPADTELSQGKEVVRGEN